MDLPDAKFAVAGLDEQAEKEEGEIAVEVGERSIGIQKKDDRGDCSDLDVLEVEEEEDDDLVEGMHVDGEEVQSRLGRCCLRMKVGMPWKESYWDDGDKEQQHQQQHQQRQQQQHHQMLHPNDVLFVPEMFEKEQNQTTFHDLLGEYEDYYSRLSRSDVRDGDDDDDGEDRDRGFRRKRQPRPHPLPYPSPTIERVSDAICTYFDIDEQQGRIVDIRMYVANDGKGRHPKHQQQEPTTPRSSQPLRVCRFRYDGDGDDDSRNKICRNDTSASNENKNKRGRLEQQKKNIIVNAAFGKKREVVFTRRMRGPRTFEDEHPMLCMTQNNNGVLCHSRHISYAWRKRVSYDADTESWRPNNFAESKRRGAVTSIDIMLSGYSKRVGGQNALTKTTPKSTTATAAAAAAATITTQPNLVRLPCQQAMSERSFIYQNTLRNASVCGIQKGWPRIKLALVDKYLTKSSSETPGARDMHASQNRSCHGSLYSANQFICQAFDSITHTPLFVCSVDGAVRDMCNIMPEEEPHRASMDRLPDALCNGFVAKIPSEREESSNRLRTRVDSDISAQDKVTDPNCDINHQQQEYLKHLIIRYVKWNGGKARLTGVGSWLLQSKPYIEGEDSNVSALQEIKATHGKLGTFIERHCSDELIVRPTDQKNAHEVLLSDLDKHHEEKMQSDTEGTKEQLSIDQRSAGLHLKRLVIAYLKENGGCMESMKVLDHLTSMKSSPKADEKIRLAYQELLIGYCSFSDFLERHCSKEVVSTSSESGEIKLSLGSGCGLLGYSQSKFIAANNLKRIIVEHVKSQGGHSHFHGILRYLDGYNCKFPLDSFNDTYGSLRSFLWQHMSQEIAVKDKASDNFRVSLIDNKARVDDGSENSASGKKRKGGVGCASKQKKKKTIDSNKVRNF